MMTLPTTEELTRGVFTNVLAMVLVALAIKHSTTIRGFLK